MKILTFTGVYLPGYKGGGPIKTIKNLFEAVISPDVKFSLVTADRDLGDSEPFSTVKVGDWNRVGGAEVFYSARGKQGLRQIKQIIKNKEHDFIYVNSFFSFRYSIYPQIFARLTQRTLVLAPRGEFSNGALSLKSPKKKLFISLYKLLGFQRNVIFQASSEYEKRDIKHTLGDVDIQIAENIGAQEFATLIPKKQRKFIRAIFVSRISPMKNLLQAIEMLALVSSRVEYDIYGPIEDREYWKKCEAAIGALPSHIKVIHRGSLNPEQVVETMAGYDMFFMPTFGENYGHVIAEGFCAGLPVLIADTTPWRQLEDNGIGWDLPLNEPQRFVEAIDEFAKMSQEEYQAKREHILAWAKHKFSQHDAVEANIALFQYAFEKSRKQ